MKEIRITAVKKVEYIEEYTISIDELIQGLLNKGFENADKYTDEELQEIACKMCEDEELEDYISKSPNADIDMSIQVEDSYINE